MAAHLHQLRSLLIKRMDIAGQHPDFRVLLQHGSHLFQLVFMPDVVLIRAEDHIARCLPKSLHKVCPPALILFILNQADRAVGVMLCNKAAHRLHGVVGGAVIKDQHFIGLSGLGQNAFQLGANRFRTVVRRQNYAQFHPLRTSESSFPRVQLCPISASPTTISSTCGENKI